MKHRIFFLALFLVASLLTPCQAQKVISSFTYTNKALFLDKKQAANSSYVSLDYSPDGQLMLIGFADRAPEIFNIAGQKFVEQIPLEQIEPGTVVHAFWSSDGKSLVLVKSKDTTTLVRYDLSSKAFTDLTDKPLPQRVKQLTKLGGHRLFALLQDSKSQLSAALIDQNGKVTTPLDLKKHVPTALAVTNDAALFALTDGTAVAVLSHGKPLHSYSPQGIGKVTALAFSPDNKYLAVTAEKKTEILELASKRTDGTTSTLWPTDRVTYTPDGRYLLGFGERLWIREVSTGKMMSSLEEAAGILAATSPDGKGVAVPDTKNKILINCWTMASLEVGPPVQPAAAPVATATDTAKTDPPVRAVKHRIWTTADGKSTVVAELVEVVGEEVVLRRRDTGAIVKLPKSILSKADQSYLDKR